MRAFVVVVGALAVLGAGGWALASTLLTSASAAAPSVAASEPIRLNASVPRGSSRTRTIRFAAVLNGRTLKWELENGNRLPRATFVLASDDERLQLCRSCRAIELGTTALNPVAAEKATAGHAVLIVEVDGSRPTRHRVAAQRCTCAAGLVFPAPAPATG